MSWDDRVQLESELKRALNSFNWPEAETIGARIIQRVNSEAELLPERTAKTFFQDLRGKRRFKLMTELAETLIQSGLRTPQIRRQYAQALIDQGLLAAPESILQSIIADSQGTNEEFEARGLLGRLYKQLYINNKDTTPRNRANLERAFKEYLHVYRLDPEKVWHGINVVAILDRAKRDGVSIVGAADPSVVAKEILNTLDKREQNATEAIPPWDIATSLEAYVALKDFKEAAQTALRYIDCQAADAFEIASTLRQLTEVWRLNDAELPGSQILPILKAGHLSRGGASMEGDPKKLRLESAAVGKALEGLEAVFGPDRMVTIKWYKQGLDQCDSIGRVEKPNGKGHGTGWVVNASDFFPGRTGLLLLTNAHVVSDNPNPFTNPKAIYASDAKVRFQSLGDTVYEVEDEVVWTSPPTELDATFLAVKGIPANAKPLRIHPRALDWKKPAPAPRFYIIGHPGGRDLEISLQDNHLVAYNERLLHYRTPTEPGNSGSPVFEPEDWRVVALHHRGGETMARIDGEAGTYEANEGVSILAIQKATRGAAAAGGNV